MEIIINRELLEIFIFSAIGYWFASGAARADYKAFHVVLGISIFSALWMFICWTIEMFTDSLPLKYVSLLIIIIGAAVFWRKCFAEKAFRWLRLWGITTTSFGPSGAWDIVESTPDGRKFYFVRVYLNSGWVYGVDQSYLKDRKEDEDDKFIFDPDFITDENGNVAMIVTHAWDSKGEKIPTEPVIDEYGRTEFTYIPATNIKMIKAYIEKK